MHSDILDISFLYNTFSCISLFNIQLTGYNSITQLHVPIHALRRAVTSLTLFLIHHFHNRLRLVVGCCCFASWQHLRSHQDGYRLSAILSNAMSAHCHRMGTDL